MKSKIFKETVLAIHDLGYNVIEYNIDADGVGHIIIKNNYITGTVIGIILIHYQIHGICAITREILQITIERK